MSDSLEITYTAHTTTCTFLLDAEGVCQRIVPPESRRREAQTKDDDVDRLAAHCVGAQYVASLDPAVAGMLAEMPRVGAAMLFARIDARGRVSLVRTGTVTRFEMHRDDDPFGEARDSSGGVETSAPPITASTPSPRELWQERVVKDPYAEELSERTQQIKALRPAKPACPPTDSVECDLSDLGEESSFDATSGAAWSSHPREASSPPPARSTTRLVESDGDADSAAGDGDPPTGLARAPLPRRGPPRLPRPGGQPRLGPGAVNSLAKVSSGRGCP